MEQVGMRSSRVIGGRYQVVSELGRGGMGIVWRAWDQVIGRDVAIKELHVPDGVARSEREGYEQRVLREARTAGRLNDPGVVTVHDVLAESGVTYIVMELVQAVTLDQLVAQRGALPAQEVAGIARQALSALECAHASGVVHRDVKPSNIMVAGGRVKLADFGIAQMQDDPRLTTTGAIIGSPSFMAPERIHGGDASPASDLWALGATLFFALEGYLPFERQTTAATLHAVVNERPQLSGAHGVLGPVVTGLLIPDPRARFTGEQVRALLESAPAERTSPLTSTTGGSRPSGRAGRWAVAAAVVAVVLFVAGAVVGRFVLADTGSSSQAASLTYGPDGDLSAFSTGSDSCGNVPVSSVDRIGEEHGVSCSEPHDFEIFAAEELFGSVDPDVAYPGEDVMTEFGNALCTANFESDKIIAVDKAALRFRAIVPNEQNWDLRRKAIADDNSDNDRQGSHEFYCVLEHVDGARLHASSQAN